MTTTTTYESAADRLDDLVPDRAVFEAYVERNLDGFSDLDVFEVAMSAGHNVMLYGPTGSGKTHAARAFAAKHGLPFYSIAGNGQTDLGQAKGKWKPQPDGSLAWLMGIISEMAIEGRGVLLLDEINMIPERVAAAVFSLLDSRRSMTLDDHDGEVVKVNPDGEGFLILAAYNPDYRGTRPLNEALANRFAFKMHFDYSDEIERDLVPLPSVLQVASQLRSMKREIRTPVSTNMLTEFCGIAETFSVAFAITNMIAAFSDGERASVRQVLELHSQRIADELRQAEAL